MSQCRHAISFLAFMMHPMVIQCELEDGHEGRHQAYRHFYPIDDVTDTSIQIFNSNRIDKTEIVWDNVSNERIVGNPRT